MLTTEPQPQAATKERSQQTVSCWVEKNAVEHNAPPLNYHHTQIACYTLRRPVAPEQ